MDAIDVIHYQLKYVVKNYFAADIANNLNKKVNAIHPFSSKSDYEEVLTALSGCLNHPLERSSTVCSVRDFLTELPVEKQQKSGLSLNDVEHFLRHSLHAA